MNQLILALVALSSVCYADNYSRTLLEQARAGNPVSMRKLSLLLSKGEEGARNARYAFEWMKKAADAGDVPALFLLGGMYENGKNTSKSISHAVEYYIEAAKEDYKPAIEKLDKMKLQHSREWHEYAAENGRYKSMMVLAKAYASGKDSLPKKKDEALRYFKMAYTADAEKTTKTAMKLPLEQASDFLEYLADEKNDKKVIKYLAESYGNGNGVEIDETKSNKYYLLAAEAGDEEAKRIVQAKGLTTLDKTFKLYEKKALSGDIDACMKLASAYWSGKELPQDKEKAMKYYRMAAAKKHQPAIAFLHREDPTFKTQEEEEKEIWRNLGARIREAGFSTGTARLLLVKNGSVTEQEYSSISNEDLLYTLCKMPVFQRVSDNQFFCLVNNDPVCIVVPNHVKVNFAENDTVTGFLVRNGEYPYVNREGQKRVVRKYTLICGVN